MSANPEFWHRRYTQQMGWTKAARRYIFDQIDAKPGQRVMEVGCGSGAVLNSLAKDGFSNSVGLDLDLDALIYATQTSQVNADARSLPLSDGCFDICLCHFLLLWVADPIIVLKEMARAATPGGWVVALAEPDYGGRIDYPDALETLGEAQTRSLQAQGADVFMGRKLKSLFSECGLLNLHGGIIASEWRQNSDLSGFELEWEVLRKDVAPYLTSREINNFYKIDLASTRESRRVLFVPILYAFGQVPADK